MSNEQLYQIRYEALASSVIHWKSLPDTIQRTPMDPIEPSMKKAGALQTMLNAATHGPKVDGILQLALERYAVLIDVNMWLRQLEQVGTSGPAYEKHMARVSKLRMEIQLATYGYTQQRGTTEPREEIDCLEKKSSTVAKKPLKKKSKPSKKKSTRKKKSK